MRTYLLFLAAIFTAIISNAQTGPLLVGATSYGGANNFGTIITYTGGDTTLNGILNSPHGPNNPICATLTEASNGKFYGLVSYGGGSGAGYIYEYDYTANTYTIVANFVDSTNGYEPWGSLLLADNGLMYGLTYMGGANNGGTLFSYAIGSDSVIALVNFPWSTGSRGSLIQASNGRLYGMSRSNGGMGSIFQYDIGANIYSVLYNFSGIDLPSGSLTEVGADTLYGMTPFGNPNVDCSTCANYGGTLFRYIIGSGVYTDLHNFDSLDNPQGSLTLASDGNLYGIADPTTGTKLFRYNIADSS